MRMKLITAIHTFPRALRYAAAAMLAAVVLAGCGGGASTEENPVRSGPDAGPSYTGPTPATADIQAFRIEFWENVRGANRCGACHNAGGQAPTFARSDDVNQAYQQAQSFVNRTSPSESLLVTKVAGGHNCWLADAASCASILSRWITSWVGSTETSGRQIELRAPVEKDPGESKRFPATAAEANFGPLHSLLQQHCSNCHRASAATPQQPYFASADINEAYLAAQAKINLDRPADSRLVVRLARESHQCWGDCTANAGEMRQRIEELFAPTAQIDPSLFVSKALTLYDGTVAAGGNRHEDSLIALYEFKTGAGRTVFDTSGVDPAADLSLAGTLGNDFEWVGGWGVMFKSNLAKAQASTSASRKFHQLITATGEYSIEAWVVPGNVTQEDAVIVGYSGSATSRNFTMAQTLYNYQFYGRSTATGANGGPVLSTADADQRLQAVLQHVVMTFDPLNGRRIYVNGNYTGDADSAGGGTLGDWDNSFAFVLGNEVSNNRPWSGVIRLVAVHNRALTAAQVQQNFEAGVGEKYFLLFGIEHLTNVPKSYIMFEVAQYDSYGYLFTNPKFISLDPSARPGMLPIKGMRIGVNGVEPTVGQAYRLLDTTVTDANYSPETGQTLSTIGTIVGLETGPASDEFFLCFDQIGSRSKVCSDFASAVPQDLGPGVPRPSDIGVRTFDAINASMAVMTGIDPNTPKVRENFISVRQSLPAVVDINAFLSSHQTSIAQLAITYCKALIDDTAKRAAYFPGLNWNTDISAQRTLLINPLLEKVIGDAGTEPVVAAQTELGNLVDDLCEGGACSSNPATRTPIVATAVCGAAVGNAAMLVR
jgi:cytochrome c553